jgi:dTDP-glucose 4,6-dehydratase
MIVLVTGGAGFIGSHFLRRMIRKYPDYQFINLDLLTYAGNLNNLADIADNPGYQFVKGDVCDRPLVESLVSGFSPNRFGPVDVIVHFAAESHVDRSIGRPEWFVRTNVLGTQVLLNAACKFNVRRYIQVSTDEVYGELGTTGKFSEEMPPTPNSPYSASKAAADLLVRAYHQTYGLPAIVTRCSNNYGPYQHPEKLIPLMITHALQDQPLPLYGDGLNVRDWLHVYDHSAALDLVMHHGTPGEIYNIGGNQERTNLEIVKMILHLLHKPDTLIRFVKDRPGHDRRYAIDAAKIRSQLGWTPDYPLEAGLADTVKWYAQHWEWWTLIKDRESQQKGGGQ